MRHGPGRKFIHSKIAVNREGQSSPVLIRAHSGFRWNIRGEGNVPARHSRLLAKRPKPVSDPARMSFSRLLILLMSLAAASVAGAVDFKKDIQPILKARCYECHSEQAKKEKAGYVFDNLERFKNDIGPKGQIVPGDVERSNFLDLVTRDKDRMPPGGKEPLTPKEVKLVREWIEQGASLDGKGGTPGKPASGLKPREPEAPPAPLQDWTSTDGKTIKARYVRMSGDAVVIKTENGKSWKVPLTKLNTASQEQAKTAAAAEAAGKPPDPG